MKLLSFIVVLVLILSSCQQRMYFPDRANVLGFKEKGEAKLTASFKPQNDDNTNNAPAQVSPSVDIAYAPVNHLAVIGSYRKTINRNIPERPALGKMGGLFNGHRIEGGLGYFTTFGRQSRFEILGGFGKGNLERVGTKYPERDFSTRYNRWFLQAAGGYSSNIISVMAGIRFAYHKYTSFKSSDSTLEYRIAPDFYAYDSYWNPVFNAGPVFNVLQTKSVTDQNFTFVEPFLNVEIGYKYVKLNGQIGSAFQTSGGRMAGNTPLYVSVGIVLHYAPRFFKKSSSNDDGNWFKD